MVKSERVPEAVLGAIQQIESADERKFSKAKTLFLRQLSDFLNVHGHINENSQDLRHTQKVPVENADTTYEFWIEENCFSPEGRPSIKRTVLNVLPSDEQDPYQIFTVEGNTIIDIDDDEIDEAEQFVNFIEILTFLDGELAKMNERT